MQNPYLSLRTRYHNALNNSRTFFLYLSNFHLVMVKISMSYLFEDYKILLCRICNFYEY